MIKYMMMFMVLLLFACQSETAEKPKSMSDTTGFIVVAPEEVPQTQEFTIRAVENGFSPDTIVVHQGDKVVLHVTNELVDTGGSKTGRDIPDASRFGISDHNVEGFYHDGGTLTISFIADKKGTFDFGDESRSVRKGRLHVI